MPKPKIVITAMIYTSRNVRRQSVMNRMERHRKGKDEEGRRYGRKPSEKGVVS